MDQILDVLQNAEKVAENILSDRQEIIDLDTKRNKNREALRQLTKTNNKENKLWLCFGNMFIKTTINSANSLINSDQKDINERVDQLRNGLKTKVHELRRLEGEEVLKGFDLKALDKEEINAIQTLL